MSTIFTYRKPVPESDSDADLPEVITVAELADLLRMNRKTLYEALARGDIPGAKRIGREYRISRPVVLRWLHDCDSHGPHAE